MGGLASGPGSRPTSMCSEMSQYMPATAVSSDAVATAAGRAAQPGMPLRRWANSASVPSTRTRPEQWPSPRTSSAAVRTAAEVVAMMTSSVAAPPAGWVPWAAAALRDVRSC